MAILQSLGRETHFSAAEGVPYRLSEYPHGIVRHSAKEYVLGNTHTQIIDGYWSQIKRQIVGTHHWVSKKHLGRCVAGSSWRYNRRRTGEGGRVNDLMASLPVASHTRR